MLKHTFLHLPGVGQSTERSLWERGILTWQDALDSFHPLIKYHRLEHLRFGVEESLARLDAGDAFYFHSLLPIREHWRLFHDFNDQAVCLDIETTGLWYGSAHITMIGLYDGREYKTFVRGKNLDQFRTEIRRYALVITYNGRRFDLPFIEAEMGPIFEGIASLDIMYALQRLGYRGGLKSVEQQTSLSRPSDLQGLSGYDAVRLWYLYLRGHGGALETLVRYNAEDVAVLLPLAALTYNLLARELPFDPPQAPMPGRATVDLPYDLELVEWLKRSDGATRDML